MRKGADCLEEEEPRIPRDIALPSHMYFILVSHPIKPQDSFQSQSPFSTLLFTEQAKSISLLCLHRYTARE